MKSVLLIAVCLLALNLGLTGSAAGRPRPHTSGEREIAAPRIDADLRWQAQQQAATLADLLLLSTAQTQHLRAALYAKLWQLQPGSPSQVMPAPEQAAALRGYHQAVLRVLRSDQYSTLLRLEAAPEAPMLARW